jgi:serine phosphatase RsbU (regulator of sigma subunit)
MEIKRDKRRFWKSLPRSSLLKLSMAVFVTFATLGFVTDLFHPARGPLYTVLTWSAYSGVGAFAFLFITMRRPAWLIGLLIAFLALATVLVQFLPSYPAPPSMPAAVQQRLILDAVFILLTIHAGYALFLYFIETEGFRHLRVQTELELAGRLQATLVPPLSLRTASLHIEARSIPSSQMGGDLADAVVYGDFLTCYIADVSGHGVAAGVTMGMVKTAVRIALLRGTELDQVLHELNGVLPQLKEPSTYVTFAGLHFKNPGVAVYITAGHSPILHYWHDAGIVERLGVEQFPVGLMPAVQYTSATTHCGNGDVFLMFTDGIVEVVNASDEEFGIDGVERILSENSTRPLAELVEALLGAAAAHGPQTDDQTILVARVTA